MYRSVIIVPADSGVEDVSELSGRDFAFGSASSTSGSLYPAIMLRDLGGIDYRTDLGEFTYTGGHDATAQAVANGRVEAGGLEDRILYNLQDEGAVDADSVRVIAESDPIEGYLWVVRDALPDELKEQIAQAYLNLDDPELLELNDEGATLLINLHDVEAARRFPRIVALREGRVVFDGPPERLTDEGLSRIYAGDPYGTGASPTEPPEDVLHCREDRVRTLEGRDGNAAH